ncbi:hypothetical protein DFH06DRAFT_1130510 [Mycena polygramma]|nr:hypothetical protein DFH06DRAFT_1130510 [Mycena polygramma]
MNMSGPWDAGQTPGPDRSIRTNPVRGGLRHRLEVLEEMRCHTACVACLRREHDDIQGRLNGTFYPFLTLPTEIIIEIFVRCLADKVVLPSSDTLPMVLGSVCRQWRSIALSTPTLWASLELTLDPNLPREFYIVLETWLSRSGQQPLTLSASYQCDSATSSSEALTLLLTNHADHMVDLELWLPRTDLVRVFDTFSGTFPLLESLQVFDTEPGVDIGPCAFSVLKTCPRLREVLSNNATLHPRPDGIPWAQLNRFQGYDLNPLNACGILRATPLLEECTLEFDVETDTDISTEPAIRSLSKLRSLKFLGGTQEVHDHGIFDIVTLPALRQLEVGLEDHTLPRFLSFLSRSSCRLLSLRLRCDIAPLNLVRCLGALPHLLELSLTHAQHILPLNTLATILRAHNSYRYAPHLQTFKINTLGPFSSTDYTAIVEMLVSRRDKPDFTHFELNLRSGALPKPDFNIIQSCEALKAGGLRIEIRARDGWTI